MPGTTMRLPLPMIRHVRPPHRLWEREEGQTDEQFVDSLSAGDKLSFFGAVAMSFADYAFKAALKGAYDREDVARALGHGDHAQARAHHEGHEQRGEHHREGPRRPHRRAEELPRRGPDEPARGARRRDRDRAASPRTRHVAQQVFENVEVAHWRRRRR